MANDKKKRTTYGSKINSSKTEKKARKGIKPETWDKIKTGLLTLVSNNNVVKAGRNYHWWVPLVLGLLSAILALVPSFVMNMTADAGQSFLGNVTYGYETGLVAFQNDLEAKNDTLSFKVIDNKIQVTGWEEGKWLTYNVQTSSSDITSTSVVPSTRSGFEVFYNYPSLELTEDAFINLVSKNMNPYASTPRGDGFDGNSGEIYRTHYIIFNENNIVLGKYPRNSTSAGQRITVKYDGVANGFDFKELAKLPENVTKGTSEATDAIRNNWKVFVRNGYESTKVGNAWRLTGIMAGVNVGVVLLFGFVIWLMTRGKFNPFRTVTVLEGFKMAGWAAPSPAILSMIGFWLSSYASFIFIFLYGIRIMWMSMRALRPYETTPSK